MEGIRQARERVGLNQSELARQIKVTPAAVRAMEEPGRYPAAEKLPAIADALECSIDALFGRRPDEGIRPYREPETPGPDPSAACGGSSPCRGAEAPAHANSIALEEADDNGA